MFVLSVFCGVSILALGYVLAAHRDASSAAIIAWLTAAIASLAIAVCARPGSDAEGRAQRGLPFLLVGILGMYTAYGLMVLRSDVVLWLLLTGAALLYLASRNQPFTPQLCLTRIFPLVLIGFTIIAVRRVWNDPNPYIDVYRFQQAAAQALMRFQNPYTATIPDIYGPSSPYYVPLVEHGRTIYGFTYPPLIGLLELPSFLLTGDVRYTHIAALLLSSCLIASMGASWAGLFAAILLLVHPFSMMIVQYAWVEPIAILFFCLTLFSARRFPKAIPYLFGLFLSTKQPLLAAVPLAPLLIGEHWERKNRIAFFLRSLTVVALLYVPFYLWNPEAFLVSLIQVQIRVPLRLDLISYPAYLAGKGWFVPPVWLPFLYLPVGVYLGLWRAPRTLPGFAAASALLFIPFFALSKQGSPNYYFLELGMMCCALALATPRSGKSSELTIARDT